MKRKRHFDWEQAFHFIWQNADRGGIWRGDAASLASQFEVSEDDAESALDELRETAYREDFYSDLLPLEMEGER